MSLLKIVRPVCVCVPVCVLCFTVGKFDSKLVPGCFICSPLAACNIKTRECFMPQREQLEGEAGAWQRRLCEVVKLLLRPQADCWSGDFDLSHTTRAACNLIENVVAAKAAAIVVVVVVVVVVGFVVADVVTVVVAVTVAVVAAAAAALILVCKL